MSYRLEFKSNGRSALYTRVLTLLFGIFLLLIPVTYTSHIWNEAKKVEPPAAQKLPESLFTKFRKIHPDQVDRIALGRQVAQWLNTHKPTRREVYQRLGENHLPALADLDAYALSNHNIRAKSLLIAYDGKGRVQRAEIVE